MIKLPYSILIYDIETNLMLTYLFRLGEQTIRHSQLLNMFKNVDIICISAKWYGESKIYTFLGNKGIKEFDKMAKKADVCLGKNSDRFDVKHINTQRMLQGLDPYPQWIDASDDLEKQCRKFFSFPSQSLDYISKLFEFGGKNKMDFEDWVFIKNNSILSSFKDLKLTKIQYDKISLALFGDSYDEIISLGKKSLSKMITYNKKDVKDTESILIKVLPYIKLKHNAATKQDYLSCTLCGSTNIVKSRVTIVGKKKFQEWECRGHKGYAGKCTWTYGQRSHSPIYGTMG